MISAKLALQTILNIEKGTHSPSIITLTLICSQMGITLKELILAALP